MAFVMIGDYAINLDNVIHVRFARTFPEADLAAGGITNAEVGSSRDLAEITFLVAQGDQVTMKLTFYNVEADQLREAIRRQISGQPAFPDEQAAIASENTDTA